MIHKKGNNISIKTATAVLMLFCAAPLAAQNTGNNFDAGTITGNFQTDVQYYFEDTTIGAPDFPENLGSNSFLSLRYNKGKFSAGLRYEAFYSTLQGFTRETGSGISYRFLNFTDEKFDVTAGTFYEQYGSGMILRCYESWGLGFDNSIDGVKAAIRPVKGIELRGLVGRQRNAFANKIEDLSAGLIRGGDAEVSFNDLISKFSESKVKIRAGASFVSRFQADDDPINIYPENVGAWAYRASLNTAKLNISAEYATKINDPSTVNGQIYKPGNGFLVQASYARKGLGISLSAKRIDNMDFRSDRSAAFNNLNLNFLPPQTKQHTYRLPTLFPYATQPLGEMGFQAEVTYRFAKGTTLGGEYGMTVTGNWSRIHGLKTTPAADPFDGYDAELLTAGKLYFQDVNLEISRKLSKGIKLTFTHFYFNYNKDLFKQLTGFEEKKDVNAHVDVLETSFKVKPKHTLRTELQHVAMGGELGNWALLMLEYTISPHWFVAVFDEYNYGNANEDKRLNYYTFQTGYQIDSYRFTVGYGRQRAGVLCVGGVCRQVPASNGFTLSITGTF